MDEVEEEEPLELIDAGRIKGDECPIDGDDDDDWADPVLKERDDTRGEAPTFIEGGRSKLGGSLVEVDGGGGDGPLTL